MTAPDNSICDRPSNRCLACEPCVVSEIEMRAGRSVMRRLVHERGRKVVALLAVVVLGLSGERPAESRQLGLGANTTLNDHRLIDAVKQGSFSRVSALLQHGADVDRRARDGATALHWAVLRDELLLVDALLAAGANVSTVNRYGVEPIALASLNGSASILARLLEAGADPNATQPGGETALMTAARTGASDAVEILLKHGADPAAREWSRNQTALMWAAAEDNAGVVRVLVAAGADVHARSNVSLDLTPNEPGDKGFTALLFAARAGQLRAAAALIDAGANVNDTLSDGTSALVLAILSAQYEMGRFLVEHGANPNAAEQGWTALHQLAWTRRPSRGPTTVGPVARGAVDSLTLARVLLEHGADVNARITKEAVEIYVGRNQMNRLGATPFFMAASRVDVNFMRFLAEYGADPFLPNVEGTTPLMAAAGVGLWFPGESPGTPDEAAASVEFCLSLGGDANTVDANGDTALHGAAYWDSPRAIELLVAAGAQLDVKNGKGWTPLRIADGVAITASIHISPEAAGTLRRLRTEQGLPVPAPIIGIAK